MAIKHAFTSSVVDNGDPDEVGPNEWNADHEVTLFDAKGDLMVASAADTAARLAVGTNGYVLTADSAEATGLKWAASAGGGSSWGQVLNLPLTSLTNWTTESGTWTAETDRIRQASTVTNTYRLRYGALVLPARAVVDVEIRTDAGNGWAGLSLGVLDTGGTGGAGVYLSNNGTLVNGARFEVEGVTDAGTTTLGSTISYGTWATLRAVLTDGSIDAWVNGTHVATGRNLVQVGTRPRLSLISRSTDASFRNLKVWTQGASLPT